MDLVFSAFLKGLSDSSLRIEAIRKTASDGISLYAVYVSVEHAFRSRLIIQKIEYEEVRTREAIFYKDVVKRNISATKLKSMLALYSAGNGMPERISQQFLLPSPNSQQSQSPQPPAAVEAKSVTWSTGSTEPSRSILKKEQAYDCGGYGAGWVISSRSVTASAAGYGAGSSYGYGSEPDGSHGVG